MNNLAAQDLRICPVLCVTRGLGTAVGRITEKPFNVLLRTVDMCYNRRVQTSDFNLRDS